MRDDLLDAQAAVKWAIIQIPRFQEALISWQRSQPYRLLVERDLNTGQDMAVAIEETPLPLVMNVEVGAIVNVLRSGSIFSPPRSPVAMTLNP